MPQIPLHAGMRAYNVSMETDKDSKSLSGEFASMTDIP
jgi:hypothetical protein